MALFSGNGNFRTGCRAHAANFNSSTYSFTILQGVVFSNETPANGATGIEANKVIEFNVTHPDGLPITNINVEVYANSTLIPATSIELVPFTNGYHVTYTPSTNYPIFANMTWKATCEVVGN